jgi:glucose-1-phosphate cytidylyltransferase
MQVVLLCGGQGTRIRDVADDLPKPMIPIGGRPIVWHIMKRYARYGFTNFILCLGYKSWVVKRFFLDYRLAHADLSLRLGAPGEVRVHDPAAPEDWHVTLAETGLDAMTGCRLKRIEKYIEGDHFLLTYGDGLADVDLRRLVDFHLGHGKIGTVTAVHAPGRFGEIEIQGRRVVEFMEKPLLARGRISGGFFALHRSIFDRLRDDPSLIFEYAPLQQLAADDQLMAYLHDGFWHPMDNSRDYAYLNELWHHGAAPWEAEDDKALRAAA